MGKADRDEGLPDIVLEHEWKTYVLEVKRSNGGEIYFGDTGAFDAEDAAGEMDEVAQEIVLNYLGVLSDKPLEQGAHGSCDQEFESPTPPLNAVKLLYFVMPAGDCDHIIGDLDETFLKRAKKFDGGYARRWYWRQAIRTAALYPLKVAAHYLRDIVIGVVSNLLGP